MRKYYEKTINIFRYFTFGRPSAASAPLYTRPSFPVQNWYVIFGIPTGNPGLNPVSFVGIAACVKQYSTIPCILPVFSRRFIVPIPGEIVPFPGFAVFLCRLTDVFATGGTPFLYISTTSTFSTHVHIGTRNGQNRYLQCRNNVCASWKSCINRGGGPSFHVCVSLPITL